MQIEDYKFGYIRVDGVEYRSDLIILPDRVIPDWWREQGHRLSLDDLKEVVEYRPEVLVIGTGASGVMEVPHEVVEVLEKAGVEVIALKTGEAVREHQCLRGEARRVVAALHLTC